MTLLHHPSDETLSRYAAGTLTSGEAVVVASHMERCPHCQRQVSRWEAVAGTLLNGVVPAPLSAHALDSVLARLDCPVTASPAPTRLSQIPTGIELPASLKGCAVGSWRSLAPGIRWSRIEVDTSADRTGETIGLLRISANKKMPAHGHSGPEFTLVLSGSFSDSKGRYGAGDFQEADSSLDHQPVADSDADCLCLFVLRGSIRPHGLVARMVQPFFGL